VTGRGVERDEKRKLVLTHGMDCTNTKNRNNGKRKQQTEAQQIGMMSGWMIVGA